MWFQKEKWKYCHSLWNNLGKKSGTCSVTLGSQPHCGPKSLEIYCSRSWCPLSLTIFLLPLFQGPLIWTMSCGTWLLPCCLVFEWLSVYEQIYMYFKDLGWPFSITVLRQAVFNIWTFKSLSLNYVISGYSVVIQEAKVTCVFPF